MSDVDGGKKVANEALYTAPWMELDLERHCHWKFASTSTTTPAPTNVSNATAPSYSGITTDTTTTTAFLPIDVPPQKFSQVQIRVEYRDHVSTARSAKRKIVLPQALDESIRKAYV